MNIKNAFDKYANEYDSWFLENINVLTSEVRLVAHFLKENAGKVLSVGCGSGLFESILKKEFNIEVAFGIEPSEGMAKIAEKRGMNVEIVSAENADFGSQIYDTLLFNGTPSYINDLEGVIKKAYQSLKIGGRIILIDIPKESSYGILYNLAKLAGTWEHPLLSGTFPKDPYPMEFVKLAKWRTSDEKIKLLEKAGFKNMKFAQTLTKHPIYSNLKAEEPIEGYNAGDYVAICASKI